MFLMNNLPINAPLQLRALTPQQWRAVAIAGIWYEIELATKEMS